MLWQFLSNVVFGEESKFVIGAIDTDPRGITYNEDVFLQGDHGLCVLVFDATKPTEERGILS